MSARDWIAKIGLAYHRCETPIPEPLRRTILEAWVAEGVGTVDLASFKRRHEPPAPAPAIPLDPPKTSEDFDEHARDLDGYTRSAPHPRRGEPDWLSFVPKEDPTREHVHFTFEGVKDIVQRSLTSKGKADLLEWLRRNP